MRVIALLTAAPLVLLTLIVLPLSLFAWDRHQLSRMNVSVDIHRRSIRSGRHGDVMVAEVFTKEDHPNQPMTRHYVRRCKCGRPYPKPVHIQSRRHIKDLAYAFALLGLAVVAAVLSANLLR